MLSYVVRCFKRSSFFDVFHLYSIMPKHVSQVFVLSVDPF